jgi:hypothetical protein
MTLLPMMKPGTSSTSMVVYQVCLQYSQILCCAKDFTFLQMMINHFVQMYKMTIFASGFMLQNLVKKKQLESEGFQRLAAELPVAESSKDTEYSRAISAIAAAKTSSKSVKQNQQEADVRTLTQYVFFFLSVSNILFVIISFFQQFHPNLYADKCCHKPSSWLLWR